MKNRNINKPQWKRMWRIIRSAYKTDIMTDGGMKARNDALDLFRDSTGDWTLPLHNRWSPENWNIPRVYRLANGQIKKNFGGIWATNTASKFYATH